MNSAHNYFEKCLAQGIDLHYNEGGKNADKITYSKGGRGGRL